MWNYRVCKNKDGYSIRECYYNDDGKIWGVSGESSPFGETFDEIKSDLQYMYGAICDEVVDLDTDAFDVPPWEDIGVKSTISLEELREEIGEDDDSGDS